MLSESESHSVMYNSLRPHRYTVHGILQARTLELFPSPWCLPNSQIEPKSPTLQSDSSPAEPTGDPENTGVGSLSLLQRIFFLPNNRTGVSCIAGGFFTSWATREALVWIACYATTETSLQHICIYICVHVFVYIYVYIQNKYIK